MANNTTWINRVLFKLNELFLEGHDFEDRRWRFDWEEALSTEVNLQNVWDEDRALETLTKAGVIKSRSLENRYRSQQLDYFEVHGNDQLLYGDWYKTDPAHREYEYERWLDGFEYSNFQRFCELHGFNPTTHGVSAEIEISSGSTPSVRVGNDTYRLQSLVDGSVPQAVISYACKNFNQEISLKELQFSLKNVQLQKNTANLNQYFRKNVFGEGNALSMFAEVRSKSIMLKSRALLTPSELVIIQKLSTR